MYALFIYVLIKPIYRLFGHKKNAPLSSDDLHIYIPNKGNRQGNYKNNGDFFTIYKSSFCNICISTEQRQISSVCQEHWYTY